MILVSVAGQAEELARASDVLHLKRSLLGSRGLDVRAASFTSPAPGEDVARLASRHGADLVLADAPEGWPGGALPEDFVVLARRDVDEVVAATEDGSLLAVGRSPGASGDGEGSFRALVAASAHPATLLVRAGLRLGGIAPAETLTRFTWTIARVPG